MQELSSPLSFILFKIYISTFLIHPSYLSLFPIQRKLNCLAGVKEKRKEKQKQRNHSMGNKNYFTGKSSHYNINLVLFTNGHELGQAHQSCRCSSSCGPCNCDSHSNVRYPCTDGGGIYVDKHLVQGCNDRARIEPGNSRLNVMSHYLQTTVLPLLSQLRPNCNSFIPSLPLWPQFITFCDHTIFSCILFNRFVYVCLLLSVYIISLHLYIKFYFKLKFDSHLRY